MTRLLVFVFALALLPLLGAQDRKDRLPPGPPPGPTEGTPWLVNALFVQANMVEGGEVLFLVPLGEPDPNKLPPPPAVFARVDGKAVRAVGTDRRPLSLDELYKRLSIREPAVVVHSQPPDSFFLKALNEHTVVFVVPQKLFDKMAEATRAEPRLGFWNVMKAVEKEFVPTGDHWIIDENQIKLHRDGKPDGFLRYAADPSDYPMTIDLIPNQGAAKGKRLKGIYELEGNALTICHVSPDIEDPEGAERPKEIGGQGTVTIRFGRVSP